MSAQLTEEFAPCDVPRAGYEAESVNEW